MPNISREGRLVLKELKKDESRMIFTAEKGLPWWCWIRKIIQRRLKIAGTTTVIHNYPNRPHHQTEEQVSKLIEECQI